MSEDKISKLETLKHDKDVKRALRQTAGNRPPEKPVLNSEHRAWLITYGLILIGLGGLVIAERLGYLDFATRFVPPIQRLTVGVAAIVLVLFVKRVVRAYLILPIEDAAARYNLNQIISLVAGVAIFFIAISILFANWYTAVVSLGLISLILGFALQTPITSFIGWIYILVKVPYSVGDRIKIGQATGDVIDVDYLDTTLWEFGGDLVSTDHPSGRIIKFPNSQILGTAVYNYSWSLFPYVWNDIKFQIAYQSDLEFVSKVMSAAAAEEVGEEMMERIVIYRELLGQTPVNQLEVKEHPAVIFRISSNTWVEAIVRYMVEPRRAGPVKTRLIKKILAELNAAPEKVMFPRGDSR